MPTRTESPAPAVEAVSGAPRTMRGLLGHRLRQLARASLILVLGVALAAGALEVWVWSSLAGLPDIGDPFDVQALRRLVIPDDRNAFTYVLRAQATLTRVPEAPRGQFSYGSAIPWSKTDPKLRAWVEENRAAIALFHKGAEQADGISRPFGGGDSDGRRGLDSDFMLMWLMLAEGGRLEAGGDAAGAWDCYRAVLRMAAHVRRREHLADRRAATHHIESLRKRLVVWAADPRTTVPLLKRALADVVESRPRPEWDAFSLKLEYLDLMRFLDRPFSPPAEQIEEEFTYRLGDWQLPTDVGPHLIALRRHLAREPERSRRVLRLLFANWLAEAQDPDPRPRGPVVRARFHAVMRTIGVSLYPVGPAAPAGARALPPQEVAAWMVTTNDAKLAFDGAFWPHVRLDDGIWPDVRQVERRGYRALVVLLAGELYRRERGSLPPSDEALVGTYLDVLPDDDSVRLDNVMIPTLWDRVDSAPPPSPEQWPQAPPD